jgi:hypothetical protein
MIVKLKTACGCERLMEVPDGTPQTTIEIVLMTPLRWTDVREWNPMQRALPIPIRKRRFELYDQFYPHGYEYREVLEPIKEQREPLHGSRQA